MAYLKKKKNRERKENKKFLKLFCGFCNNVLGYIQLFSMQIGQLNEIRRVKLSRIVCDNSDNIESAQVYVMVLPDPDM